MAAMLRSICIFTLIFTLVQCGHSRSELQMVALTGTTMGNISYNVKYYHPDGTSYKTEIDSLLNVWNQSLSTYITDSEISRFNRDSCHIFESRYFYPVLQPWNTRYL